MLELFRPQPACATWLEGGAAVCENQGPVLQEDQQQQQEADEL